MSDAGAISTTELAEASEAPVAKRTRSRTKSSSSVKSSKSLDEEGQQGQQEAPQEENKKEEDDASATQPLRASHNGAPSRSEADSQAALASGADLDAPKKPTGGGYGIFLKENREEIKKSLPADHRVTDVAKAAGTRWRALSDEEKLPYQTRFKAASVEYKERMAPLERSGLERRRKARTARAAKISPENASAARGKKSSRGTTRRRSPSSPKRHGGSVPKVGIGARVQEERRLREEATDAGTPAAIVATLVGNAKLSVEGSKEFSRARTLCRDLAVRCIFCRFLMESAKASNVRFCENFFSCQSARHPTCVAKGSLQTADDGEAGQSSWVCTACVARSSSARSSLADSACSPAAGIVVETSAPPQRSRSASQGSQASPGAKASSPDPPPSAAPLTRARSGSQASTGAKSPSLTTAPDSELPELPLRGRSRSGSLGAFAL